MKEIFERGVIITYFDLIKDNEFRSFIVSRLNSKEFDSEYKFSKNFPKLYRYRPFSKYAVDDIINGKITATTIGDFNDLFDGSIQSFSTVDERHNEAEKEWKELETLREAAGIREEIMGHDSYMQLQMKVLKRESRQNFRLLDYLGTYVCCFSVNNTSTLMWSHYANSNTGICVEYDFNNSKIGDLVFPVKYTRTPVELQDLLSDKGNLTCKYPFDAAVLCAALNKADVWGYEQEWRTVFVFPLGRDKDKVRRLQLNSPGLPKSISLGYHFFKPLFYYDHTDVSEKNSIIKRIEETEKLFEFIEENNISVFISVPTGDNFNLKSVEVKLSSVRSLFNYYFMRKPLMRVDLYHIVHDELLDIVEDCN